MDEANLKEVLTKFSEKSYTPSFSNEISGWVTDSKANKKFLPPKKLSTSLITAKIVHKKKQKLQKVQIKKPLSLFQFHSIQQSAIKYRVSPKKLVKNIKRPASSISKPKPASPQKGRYSKIMLNKTIVFENLLSSSRNFSPNRTNCVNKFRRSSSSTDNYSQNPLLTVHGSSCYLKTLN